MEGATAGDPTSSVKWTRKSTRALSRLLRVSHTEAWRMLRAAKYRLRFNRKRLTRRSAPDRNQQFTNINRLKASFAHHDLSTHSPYPNTIRCSLQSCPGQSPLADKEGARGQREGSGRATADPDSSRRRDPSSELHHRPDRLSRTVIKLFRSNPLVQSQLCVAPHNGLPLRTRARVAPHRASRRWRRSRRIKPHLVLQPLSSVASRGSVDDLG